MVTFETKVWEKDWEYILKGNYLDEMIASCHHKFDKKTIIINNVKDRNEVEKYCEEKIEQGIIDSYFVAEDYKTEVLKHFDIEIESFRGGYYYSIAELVGIYVCETDYLFHLSSDTFLLSNNDRDWISEEICMMNDNENIWVGCPKPWWVNNKSSNDFYLCSNFSDQAYLIRKKDFINPIYSEKHKDSEAFPKYGGELFEKRVHSYMNNHQKVRLNYTKTVFRSVNFPKSWFSRKILRHFIIYLRISEMKGRWYIVFLMRIVRWPRKMIGGMIRKIKLS